MASSVETKATPVRRPIAATLGVVCKDGQVLMIRRRNAPDVGRWSFPGGKIDFGEAVLAATEREITEETSVHAKALQVVTAVDAHDIAADGGLRQHYILIAVVCGWIDGEPYAGDDAVEARWFDIEQLAYSDIARSFDVLAVAKLAYERYQEVQSEHGS